MKNRNQTVYFDDTVVIEELYLKIFKYYLPLATSKTIFFKEISHIIYHRNQKIDVFWGASSRKLNDWFSFDKKRPKKRGYFEIVMKQNDIRPCFSPIEPERVFNVLLVNHSSEGIKLNEQNLMSTQPAISLPSREESLDLPNFRQKSDEKREPQEAKIIRKRMEVEREPFQELTNVELGDDCDFENLS